MIIESLGRELFFIVKFMRSNIVPRLEFDAEDFITPSIKPLNYNKIS